MMAIVTYEKTTEYGGKQVPQYIMNLKHIKVEIDGELVFTFTKKTKRKKKT